MTRTFYKPCLEYVTFHVFILATIPTVSYHYYFNVTGFYVQQRFDVGPVLSRFDNI